METTIEVTPAQLIQEVAARLGLSIESKFIPWSQSRNKGEKQPSLNWSVTLRRNGREVLTTDYSAGFAHCPSYRQNEQTVEYRRTIKNECESGCPKAGHFDGQHGRVRTKHIEPKAADVLYSLCSDSDVIDVGGFEEWANNFGMDTDSRKAEAIYLASLNIALKLRSALGDDGLKELREAFQNY